MKDIYIYYIYVCMYVCMHVCMYVCMYVYVCIHACMHACMYVYIYIHNTIFMVVLITLMNVSVSVQKRFTRIWVIIMDIGERPRTERWWKIVVNVSSGAPYNDGDSGTEVHTESHRLHT